MIEVACSWNLCVFESLARGIGIVHAERGNGFGHCVTSFSTGKQKTMVNLQLNNMSAADSPCAYVSFVRICSAQVETPAY
jgi:hypothetical protein